MSEVQRLIVKEDEREYEIYVESKTATEVPEEEEPGYRDGLPTLNIAEFQIPIIPSCTLQISEQTVFKFSDNRT